MELFSQEYSLIVWIVFGLILLVMPVIALISALTGTFKDSTTKLTWVLVIIFAPLFGWILYFLVGKKQRDPNT